MVLIPFVNCPLVHVNVFLNAKYHVNLLSTGENSNVVVLSLKLLTGFVIKEVTEMTAKLPVVIFKSSLEQSAVDVKETSEKTGATLEVIKHPL
jgi:hypothetical protein